MPAPVDDDGDVCPVIRSLQIVGSMWRMAVIRYLLDGPKGFNELLRTMPGLNSKNTIENPQVSPDDGSCGEKGGQHTALDGGVFPDEDGMELKPVIYALRTWGSRWTAATSPPRAKISEPYKVRVKPSR